MKILSSKQSASATLAAMWLFFFTAVLCVPCLSFLQKKIEADTLVHVLVKLADMYAVPLGAVFAFYFVSRSTGSTPRNSVRRPFFIALIATLIWNGFIAALMAGVLVTATTLDEATNVIAEVVPKLSWLVGPALGYFFASNHQEPTTSG